MSILWGYENSNLPLRESHIIEKSLFKQIKNSIEHKYLQKFKSPMTNDFKEPMKTLLEQLFTKYGKVQYKDVKKKIKEIKNMEYCIEEYIQTLFDNFENLKHYSEAVHMPITDKQSISIGIEILKKPNDFHRGLEEWFYLDRTNQTQNIFKRTFQKVKGP